MYLTDDYITMLPSKNLADFTGFGTGGDALAIYAPKNLLQLSRLLKDFPKRYILGKGTNVIAYDEGYNGTVILTKNLNAMSVKNNCITFEAGVMLSDLCKFALENSLSGVEELYGIPGTMGGAIFMNAGAYDTEIKDVLKTVTVFENNKESINYRGDRCGFSYRTSRFQDEPNSVILKGEIVLTPAEGEAIKKKMDAVIEKRKASQPLEYRSCGSTFKRPQGAYASKLIDECGLKGLTIGGAMVSTKHAGFIINYNNASSSDIFMLMAEVARIVYLKTGYELIPEVRVLE